MTNKITIKWLSASEYSPKIGELQTDQIYTINKDDARPYLDDYKAVEIKKVEYKKEG